MWLKHRNPGGGSSLRWNGTEYEWPAGNPVCEVPDELGHALLALGTHEETEAPKAAPKPPAKAEPAKAEPAKAAAPAAKPDR